MLLPMVVVIVIVIVEGGCGRLIASLMGSRTRSGGFYVLLFLAIRRVLSRRVAVVAFDGRLGLTD